MLDTVKLRSPALSEDVAEAVERSLQTRAAWRNDEDGEFIYEFIGGSLAGSWDAAIAVNLCREEWVAIKVPGQKHQVCKMVCEPYVTIEGSVHKAMLGHNVTGGPLTTRLPCVWFVAECCKRLCVELPHGDAWSIDRLDWAEAYQLPSPESCAAYIRSLAQADYPRRKPRVYMPETVFFPGITTAFKVYWKGPEFRRHDKKRLSRVLSDGRFLDKLEELAFDTVRFESSIKAEKLKRDHDGARPLVRDFSEDYAIAVHEQETRRMVKESEATVQQVCTSEDVQRRLSAVYGGRKADVLYGTWLRLAAHGESQVKETWEATRMTFYRHRRDLVDAGCNWRQSDVRVIPNLVPVDFRPCKDSPYRVTHQEATITRMLASVV